MQCRHVYGCSCVGYDIPFLIKLIFFVSSCHYSTDHSLVQDVKKRLKGIIDEKYSDYKDIYPEAFEQLRLGAIENIVNEQVARFLRSLLDSYISLLLMYEYKLQNETHGKSVYNSTKYQAFIHTK